jgi:hypothetical protein
VATACRGFRASAPCFSAAKASMPVEGGGCGGGGGGSGGDLRCCDAVLDVGGGDSCKDAVRGVGGCTGWLVHSELSKWSLIRNIATDFPQIGQSENFEPLPAVVPPPPLRGRLPLAASGAFGRERNRSIDRKD